jgi:hypothetical protein
MANNQALAVVKDEQLAIENVAALRQANFLVLAPTDQVLQLNPVFAARLTHVPVSTDMPSGKTSNVDLWKPPGGGSAFAPTKVLLSKIASAANIQWDVKETKRIDDRSDRYYCAYQAVGYMRLPSGEMKVFRDEATENATIMEEEILQKWMEKLGTERVLEWANGRPSKKGTIDEAFAKSAARKEFLAYWKFFEERCMARAMNRAIRQVLALNGTYTLEELKKGFIVPQVNFSPDWDNPDNHRALEALMYGGISNMLGKGPATLEATAATAQIEAPKVDAFTGEVKQEVEKEPTEEELAELDAIMNGDEGQGGTVEDAEIIETNETAEQPLPLGTAAPEPEKKAQKTKKPDVKIDKAGWPIAIIDLDGPFTGRFPKRDEYEAMTEKGLEIWKPRVERALELAKQLGII